MSRSSTKRTPRGRQVALLTNPGGDLYGSDRMLLESVSALQVDGFDVVVTLSVDGPLADEVRLRGGRVVMCPTPIVRKSSATARGFARLAAETATMAPAGVRLIRRIAPDVIYVNTVTTPLWLLLAWLTRTPRVCHVHEAEASASRVKLLALTLPLLLAQRVVVNSEFSWRVLSSALARSTRRAVVVYNAVAGPAVAEPARECISGPVRLLYVGRLSPRKGPDVLIEALAVLRSLGVSAELSIVGAVYPGYEWFDVLLRARVAALDLSDQVRFLGFQRDRWQATAASDIAIVPSTLDEPFGNTAVEAMLGARPLVVSEIAGLLEASAGFESVVRVAPSDSAAIASAVRAIVANWPEYRDHAVKDAAVAAYRFSAQSYSVEIARTVRGLIGQ